MSRHELRQFHTAVLPNVYQEKHAEPTLLHRTQAAWLWSQRQAIVSGLAASALHGANWVDDDVTVELIWRNARTPRGVKSRADLILDGESQRLAGVVATTPERTAFDLGRRGPLRQAVARLDALANATHFKIDDVTRLAARHRHTRGLRQLEAALYLVDAGAQSPKETWLRLLLSDAGFPRPTTQILVLGPDGYPKYFLDMGWQDIMLTVEYDGDQHRTSRSQFVKDVERQEYIRQAGWTHVTVLAEHRGYDVVRRVRAAWDALKRR